MKLLPNIKPEYVIFEADPGQLIAKITQLLDKLNAHYLGLYN